MAFMELEELMKSYLICGGSVAAVAISAIVFFVGRFFWRRKKEDEEEQRSKAKRGRSSVRHRDGNED